MSDGILAAVGKGPQHRTADKHGGGAERAGLDNILATAHARVEQDGDAPPHGGDDLGQGLDGGHGALELARAVVADDDGGGAGGHGELRVVGAQDALDPHGQPRVGDNPAQLGRGQVVLDGGGDGVQGGAVVGGLGGVQGGDVGVGKVGEGEVGRHVEGVGAVALAAAEARGVDGEDDGLVAGGAGAAQEGEGEGAVAGEVEVEQAERAGAGDVLQGGGGEHGEDEREGGGAGGAGDGGLAVRVGELLHGHRGDQERGREAAQRGQDERGVDGADRDEDARAEQDGGEGGQVGAVGALVARGAGDVVVGGAREGGAGAGAQREVGGRDGVRGGGGGLGRHGATGRRGVGAVGQGWSAGARVRGR